MDEKDALVGISDSVRRGKGRRWNIGNRSKNSNENVIFCS